VAKIISFLILRITFDQAPFVLFPNKSFIFHRFFRYIMKQIWFLILALTFIACNRSNPGDTTAETKPVEAAAHGAIEKNRDKPEAPEGYTSKDLKEIRTLIRKTLNWWNDLNGSLDILPVKADKDSCYWLDLKKHRSNLNVLRKTSFFAEEFIENYNRIILTLNSKMKNKEFEKWKVGHLPTFYFASGGMDPWCKCQDVPYDEPNPWDFIQTKVIRLDSEKGELLWKWGNLKPHNHPSWKEPLINSGL
jgi:hypothetical protein